MIQSFADEITEDIFHGVYSHAVRKALTSGQVKMAERRLDLLNCADSLKSLSDIPSIAVEGPVRDAHGKYSIPLDRQWRLVFGWNDGPEKVEIKCW
jgi:toxin HigB-1